MKTLTVIALFSIYPWFMCLGVVKSTTNIQFDVQSNGTIEGTWTTNGLGLGTTSPSSTLEVQGSMGFGVQVCSSNILLSSNTLILADPSSATGGNLVLTLPMPSSVAGRLYRIKKISSGNLDISGNGYYIDYSAKVSSTHSGLLPTIEVISSGSQWHLLSPETDVTPSLAVTDNLMLWLDASDRNSITLDSSGNVSQWNDKSARGLHASVGGTTFGSSGPVYSSTSTTELAPALIFSSTNTNIIEVGGTSDFKFLHDGTGGQVFMVVQSTDTTTGLTLLSTAKTSSEVGFYMIVSNGTVTYLPRNTSGIDGSASISTLGTGKFVLSGSMNATGTTVYSGLSTNSSSAFTTGGSPSTSNQERNLQIGTRKGSTDNLWNGRVAEVIIYNKILSSTEFSNTVKYLNKKWGL